MPSMCVSPHLKFFREGRMDNHNASQQIKNQIEKIVIEAILSVLDKLIADITAMRESTSEMKF
jgi:hypothetical protein